MARFELTVAEEEERRERTFANVWVSKKRSYREWNTEVQESNKRCLANIIKDAIELDALHLAHMNADNLGDQMSINDKIISLTGKVVENTDLLSHVECPWTKIIYDQAVTRTIIEAEFELEIKERRRRKAAEDAQDLACSENILQWEKEVLDDLVNRHDEDAETQEYETMEYESRIRDAEVYCDVLY